VLDEVATNAVAECVFTEVLLEHAKNGATFYVGQNIEHASTIIGRDDFVFNGSCRVEAVDGKRNVTRRIKAHPFFPLRAKVIGANGFHERGEGFVEPDSFPPVHRDQVTEPHVRYFVVNHQGNAVNFGKRCNGRINQKIGHAKGHEAEILHGSSREVRNGCEVEFVAGVGNGEVVAEERQRMLDNF